MAKDAKDELEGVPKELAEAIRTYIAVRKACQESGDWEPEAPAFEAFMEVKLKYS